MKITVQIKNVYGNQTIYPICESAKTFAAMLGQRTLTMENIHYIKALGYEVEVQQHVVKL